MGSCLSSTLLLNSNQNINNQLTNLHQIVQGMTTSLGSLDTRVYYLREHLKTKLDDTENSFGEITLEQKLIRRDLAHDIRYLRQDITTDLQIILQKIEQLSTDYEASSTYKPYVFKQKYQLEEPCTQTVRKEKFVSAFSLPLPNPPPPSDKPAEPIQNPENIYDNIWAAAKEEVVENPYIM